IVTSGAELVGHNLTEYAPVSNYQDGGDVKVRYTIENGVAGFAVDGSYDKTKTLIIDPTIDPKFSGVYDIPYDMDYDNSGNVYVYGAYNPYQVTMINSAGTVVWTFNPSTIYLNDVYKGTPEKNYFNDQGNYGGFCVDKVGKFAYVSEGFDPYGGCAIVQINSSGAQSGLFKGTLAMIEMWRMQYNICSAEILIGGGGTNTPSGQLAQLKGLATLTSYDVYNTNTGNNSQGKDISRMCIEPTGSPVYLNYSTSTFQIKNPPPPYANYDNDVFSVAIPVPAGGAATNSAQKDGQAILELGSVWYIGPGLQPGSSGSDASFTCGFNGMAASPNGLYDWDGYTLRKLNKAGLTASNSITIGTAQTNYTSKFNWNGAAGVGFKEADVYWGGLAADACDYVYVGNVVKAGNVPQVSVYNSALVLQSTTPP
ncbi:MAG TPA: hypothetical protein VNZ45_16415, partial [Bacteroidia bacterium]|nr:hypothetical protein [Bacteroidia bacterium]